MPGTETENVAKLAIASSNLRRISYFTKDASWTIRQPIINRFLKQTRESLNSVEPEACGRFKENFLSMKKAFHKLLKDWPGSCEHPKERLVWCEEAMTLSLRLYHLSKVALSTLPLPESIT